MGIAERKQREKEQRRKSILDQARALILKKGAASLTMADIAQATELSKAALYLYFRSKEDLITEILVDATGRFADFMESRLQQVETGLDQLTVIARSFLEFYRESEDLFVFSGIAADTARAVTDLARSEDSQGRLLWGRFEAMIRTCLKNGTRDGSFSPALDIPETVRTILLVCTTMVAHLSAIPGPHRNPAMVLREIAGVFAMLRAALTNKNADQAALIKDLVP